MIFVAAVGQMEKCLIGKTSMIMFALDVKILRDGDMTRRCCRTTFPLRCKIAAERGVDVRFSKFISSKVS